jgi:GntR family transcriptional regulator
MIDRYNPLPLYVQLADLIEADIKAGKYAPGQVLPSEDHIRQTYGVARGTVRVAMGVLRERGVIVTMPYRGHYVAPER